jgi:hypothetical protein
MKDHGLSLNQKCPCIQERCALRGNCVLCVQNHVERGSHVPECMQDMLRDKIESLARLTELRTAEGRPKPEHWDGVDPQEQIRGSIARHGDPDKDEAQ